MRGIIRPDVWTSFLAVAFAVASLVTACGSSTSSRRANPSTGGAEDGGDEGAGGARGTGGEASGGEPTAGGASGGGAPEADAAADAPEPPCTLAADWTVVDDYAATNVNHTNPSQLLATSDGTLYATGLTLAAGAATGFLRSSTDGARFTQVRAEEGIGGDIVANSQGTLFVTGDQGAGTTRVVKRSTDGGVSWETVDSVALDEGACNTGNLAVTRGGSIYWGGSCDATGWSMRVSRDGGDTWSDVDTLFTLAPGMPARLAGVLVDSEDRVYVSGTAQDASQVAHWIVRRLGVGSTFSTVDDFVLEEGQSAIAPTLHGTDRVYAVGGSLTADGAHLVVRRANVSAVTWTTLDDYSAGEGTSASGVAVHEALDGEIVVVGTVTDANGLSRVITRRSTDDGVSWSVPVLYDYVVAKGSTAAGRLVADSGGNVYGLVRGVAADDHAHFIVRRLACER